MDIIPHKTKTKNNKMVKYLNASPDLTTLRRATPHITVPDYTVPAEQYRTTP
jgi:hypothetical protein